MFGTLKKTTLAAVLVMSAGVAQAATVSCPGTVATTDREFGLTTAVAATCHATGVGNFDNTYNTALLLPSVLLDKTDEVNASGVVINYSQIETLTGWQGTFSIVVPLGMMIVDMFLALKSGQGQLDPDWALFELADNTLSGSWFIDNSGAERGNPALSHMNVYGRLVPAAIPVPAAGLLLLGALGGLAALRRRKTA